MSDFETLDGGKAMPPVPEGDDAELAGKCDDDRAALTPHETADCAGIDLVREYENEEDGGS